jgi:hypothetical protein
MDIKKILSVVADKIPAVKSSFKIFIFAALALASFLLCGAASAETAETILKVTPKDAGMVMYIGDIHDFQNYSKWSPIYDYLISDEFGGIYLTGNGKSVVDKMEKAVKMPLLELPNLIKSEIAAWFDFGNFDDKPVNFAMAFRPADINRTRSIIDDNFINNAPDSKSEKLGYSDYSYFVQFKFKNPLYKKTGGTARLYKNEFIEGRFAIAVSSDLVLISTTKDYLQKMLEYSRSAADPAGSPFYAYLSGCGREGKSGFFVNFEAVVSAGLKSLKDNMAALKEGKKEAKENKKGASSEQKSAQLETVLAVIETLGLNEFKSLFASHRLADNGMIMEMRFDYAREGALLKFAGPDLDFMAAAKLCPADASSAAVISIDYTAIIEAVDAVFEKLPLTARAQYFMAKSAVLSTTGMKLKEDIADMLGNQLVVVNKIEKSKDLNTWTSRPTFVVKLKNPKTAEKLLAKLTEQKLMTSFEIKEYMGKKYFSAPLPGPGKQVMCLMLEGDYLIFSLHFDHFTAAARNITDPQNPLAGVKKFADAAKELNPKAVYFFYTSDDDMAEYYVESNYNREDLAFGPEEFFARYDYKKINWEKVRRRQAPTAGSIYRTAGSFEGRVFGGFKRD